MRRPRFRNPRAVFNRRMRPLLEGVTINHPKWGPGTTLRLVETNYPHPKDPLCYLWQAQIKDSTGLLQELWQAELAVLRRIIIGYHPTMQRYLGSGRLYREYGPYDCAVGTMPSKLLGGLYKALQEHARAKMKAVNSQAVRQVHNYLTEEIHDEL